MKPLQRAMPGDLWRARDVNELREAIAALDRALAGAAGIALRPDETPPPLVVELAENIAPEDEAREAAVLQFRPEETAGLWHDSQRRATQLVDLQEAACLAGERHVAMHHASSGKRVLAPGPRWHLAVLADELAAGGSASASLWRVTEGAELDAEVAVTVFDWLLPAGQTLPAGSKVAVWLHPQSRRWYALANLAGAARRRFELTGTLVAGGSAAAKPLVWDGAALDVVDESFTVVDRLGIFSGSAGDRGLCELWGDAGAWEVYQMVCS